MAARMTSAPPLACTVRTSGCSRATVRAAPATVAGMSCSLRSRKIRTPLAPLMVATTSGPYRRYSSRPIFTVLTCGVTRPAQRAAVSRSGASSATATGAGLLKATPSTCALRDGLRDVPVRAGHGRPRRPPVTRNVPVTAPARGLLLTLTLLTSLGPLVAGIIGRAATPAAPSVRDRRCIAASRGRFIGRLARAGRSTAAPEGNAPRLRLRRASQFPAHPSRTYPGVGAAPPCHGGIVPGTLVVPTYTHRHHSVVRGRASACHGRGRRASGVHPGRGKGTSTYTGSRQRHLCVQPGRGKGTSAYNRVAAKAPLRTPGRGKGTSAYNRVAAKARSAGHPISGWSNDLEVDDRGTIGEHHSPGRSTATPHPRPRRRGFPYRPVRDSPTPERPRNSRRSGVAAGQRAGRSARVAVGEGVVMRGGGRHKRVAAGPGGQAAQGPAGAECGGSAGHTQHRTSHRLQPRPTPSSIPTSSLCRAATMGSSLSLWRTRWYQRCPGDGAGRRRGGPQGGAGDLGSAGGRAGQARRRRSGAE